MTATARSCRCGAPIYPAPSRPQGGGTGHRNCTECRRVRRWAHENAASCARQKRLRTQRRETGDWNCTACGSLQGPLENVRCSLCGCNVTTGEPVAPHWLKVVRKVEHPLPDPLGEVVWNGASGVSLLADSHPAPEAMRPLRLERDLARRHRIDVAVWPGWFGSLSQA